MATLRLQFLHTCSERNLALREAWSGRDRAALGQIAHSLAGRAGMFGFAEIGAAARALELSIERGDQEALEPALGALLQALHDAEVPGTSG